MRLRDFSIILIIIGIATSVFLTMMTDSELEDNYGTLTAHAEDNSSDISDALLKAAESNRNKTAELQNRLQQESDVSLFGLGADTFKVVKTALTFEYLEVINSVFYEIEEEYSLPANIGASLFAILVVVIVFTIVGAFLRWRS